MSTFERQAWHDLRPKPRAPGVLQVPETWTHFKATWWAQAAGGNRYYRCEVPARHLPGEVWALRTNDLKMVNGQITMPRQKGKTAIWSYPGNATRGILMKAQQEAGVRVLVEVDDNYLIASPPVPRKSKDWQLKIKKGDDTHTHEAHERLARMADGIIVTTEELARAYRRVNANVYVCRNSVELKDWEEPEKPSDGIFRIGYAASHSHWFDANDVHRALSWAAHQPGVEVVMLGLDPGWAFPYTHVPWTKDLAEYRRNLQVLDVGLCPLREGPWAACKSDVKAIELAMSGAMSIVAFEEPYRPWWDNDEIISLLAPNPKDFLKQVKWCVANQDGVKQIAAQAKQYVLGERLIEHEIDKWRLACSGS